MTALARARPRVTKRSDGRGGPTRPARRGVAAVVAVVVAAAVIADQARIVWSASRSIVNSDGALLWAAAREWGRFRIRQPHFYGQTYGTTLEAVPIEVLRRLGVPLWTATPLTLAACSLGAWLLLAWAGWRRGHPVLAIGALAAPALLSGYYAVFVSEQPVSPAPRLLAVVGVTILLLSPRRVPLEAVAWALLGFAAVVDAGSPLVSIPVAAWFVLSHPDARNRARAVALGAIVPAAWVVGSWFFYRAHPDYSWHYTVSTSPKLQVLSHSFGHLPTLFALYAPELVRSFWVPGALTIVLAGALLATRRVVDAVPAALVGLLVLYGMATPRAGNDHGVSLPAGRIFLALPYALWFLALLVAESGLVRPRLTVVVSCALAIALTATLGVRAVAFHTRVMAARDAIVRSSGAAYPLDPPRVVRARCAARAEEAIRARTTIVVYLTDLKMAYACSALAYGNVEGFSADNDRRTWLFYDELHHARTAAVIADVASPQAFCAFASQRATACRQADDRAVVIGFAPQTLLAELRVLGVPVRDFGPHCHLHGTSTRTCSTPLKLAGAPPSTGPLK